jgi:hypothetical protein
VVLFEGGSQFTLHIIWENSLVVPAGSTSKQQCFPPKHPTTTRTVRHMHFQDIIGTLNQIE